ncbi:phosphatase [Paenibacillus darwinianus]|uniref:Phosphatase n=1 Tax=Paenibacillus darwinianus TaxID=1380763 RepID=A0A9W5S0K9_9BACL|nr:aspartyl-phosphate phosphatase Spo0E family protein [Paenibacillus darwinianus]EXX88283.1 phosphatase [Paenibacillus darwinianus]EXX88620.1 phosphatase [Paenibacillus darwinianus]EXX91755.1 phosphatase [Paenibacillus darwinianus]
MDKQLLVQVERLRGKMVAAAIENNTLHQEVLHLSQSLDELILQVQVEKRAKAARRKNS